MKKFTALGISILVVSGLLVGWSILEYVKQQQKFGDYFTKPSRYPLG